MTNAYTTDATRACLALEAAAVSTALMAGDFNESRFRTRLLMAYAADAGEIGLADAAAGLYGLLGRHGEGPLTGFSVGLLHLADAVDVMEGRPHLSMPSLGNLDGRQGNLGIVTAEAHRPLAVWKRYWAAPGEYIFSASRYAHRSYKAFFGLFGFHGK